MHLTTFFYIKIKIFSNFPLIPSLPCGLFYSVFVFPNNCCSSRYLFIFTVYFSSTVVRNCTVYNFSLSKFIETEIISFFLSFKLFIIYLFFYFWLCWVFVSVQGLSLVAASGGHSSSRCAGLTVAASLVAEHRLQTRRLSSCGSRA